MLHAQTQAARLCLEEVAQALARQAIARKSLFLAHHHERLCRQAYFLYKEHTALWYVEAQQAVYQLSWMADSRRLRFRQWRTVVLPEARSTALRKLAAASSCWEQAHVSLSTNIQADEASARRYVSSARSDPYVLTADDFVGPPMGHPRGRCTAHEAHEGREPT